MGVLHSVAEQLLSVKAYCKWSCKSGLMADYCTVGVVQIADQSSFGIPDLLQIV